jgi:AraC-like DNA-binding protein
MLQIMNKKTRNDRKIARSVAFISQHLNESINVAQLAEKANLSPSYFWALFKQKTGYAPVDFLIRLRMRQACHLLNSTNLKIKKIAAVLGYKDSLYFSRLFKSVHGVAPTDYRIARSNAIPLLPEIVPQMTNKPANQLAGLASGD